MRRYPQYQNVVGQSSAATAAPTSCAPSQYVEGNDGKWSTFVVRVGTPEQSFRVLPSTVSSETFLPMAGACKDDEHMSTVGLAPVTYETS